MVNFFNSKILLIIDHTERLRSFKLSIPDDINWSFLPGQYIDFAFFDQPNRFSGYSLASTPQDNFISISVQKTEDYNASHRMFQLQTGDTILVRGPAGDFTLDCNKIHYIVLIAGGIGVTPLVSMFRTAYLHPLVKQVLFFHSAKLTKELIFQDEFQQASNNNPHFSYFTSVTKQRTWHGKNSRFNIEDVLTNIDLTIHDKFQFFICGPSLMNSDFTSGL